MQLDQRVDGSRVDRLFVLRMIVDPFLHAVVAEIFGQHPALSRVLRKDFGGTHTVFAQPARDVQEGLRILVRGRRVHQHGGVAVAAEAEVAPEARIARQRVDCGGGPVGACKEMGQAIGQVVHGKRLCQALPASTMACLPSPTVSNVIERQVGSCAKPPA